MLFSVLLSSRPACHTTWETAFSRKMENPNLLWNRKVNFLFSFEHRRSTRIVRKTKFLRMTKKKSTTFAYFVTVACGCFVVRQVGKLMGKTQWWFEQLESFSGSNSIFMAQKLLQVPPIGIEYFVFFAAKKYPSSSIRTVTEDRGSYTDEFLSSRPANTDRI